MQLLKQIWNERRSNGWLWSELLIVFVVLWYVVDWTYVTARTYYEPVGFDITDTYYLELSLKNDKSNSYLSKEQKSTSLQRQSHSTGVGRRTAAGITVQATFESVPG